MIEEADLSKKGTKVTQEQHTVACCQAGETKAHRVFFTDTFFWWFGTSVKVQKVSNFLGGRLWEL